MSTVELKMLVPMSGTHLSLAYGDVHECGEAEAKRLIENNHATPHDEKATGRERATKPSATEAR